MAGDAQMAVSVLLNARDRLTGSVAGARRMTQRLGDTVTRIGRNAGFDRLRRRIDRTRTAAGGLVRSVGRVSGRLAAVAGGATAALVGATTSVADHGDSVAKMADQYGIGIESLQEYQFAAERMGVSQSTFNQGISAFAKRVGEARQGMGRLQSQLKDQNPELLKNLKNTKSVDEALRLYLQAIDQAPDAIDKTALASAGFSRGAQDMSRIVRDGMGEVDRLRERAQELGVVLSEDAARDAEAFQDSMTNMQGSVTGLKNLVGGALLPVITSTMDRITAYVVGNRDAVRDWAEGFAAKLPGRLQMLRDGFASAVESASNLIDRAQPLIDVVRSIADRFGAMNTAVAGVAAILAAPILAPLVSLTASLVMLGSTTVGITAKLLSMAGAGTVVKAGFTAIAAGIRAAGAAVLANPIVATIALIAGAAYLIYRNWDTIAPYVQGVWDAVTGIVSDAHAAITGWLGFDPVAWMRPLWDGMTQYVGGIMAAIRTIVSGDMSGIGDLLLALSPLNILKPAFKQAYDWLSSIDWSAAGRKLLGTVVDGLKRAGGAAKDAVQDSLSKTYDWLSNIDWSAAGKKLLGTFVDGLTSAGGAVVDSVKGVFSGVMDYFPGSDAKRGPLSNLTRSGRALPATFAGGVADNGRALVGAVDRVMAAANDSLATPLRGPTIEAGNAAVAPGRAPAPPRPARAAERAVEGARVVPLRLPAAAQMPAAEAAIDGLAERLTRAIPAPAASHTTERERVVEREAAREQPRAALLGAAGGGTAPAEGRARTRRGVHVERVEFAPQVTIQAGEEASAVDIADEFDRRMAGWRDADLWGGVQDLPGEDA
ncbi:hypothetical protein [Salinisphaera orenii]|uniref:Uncharacterized protein n=1 Tax=Salinisphaera orenii YIM 95161 TaxID=1051139 RepID=A0A423PRQ2_9GAMM|nr:hypothetical protein [Salinisphaera halophila]ROO28285.1 hypothetical protein SAHL_10885 [Salinisphaera halophila YIM 95161]